MNTDEKRRALLKRAKEPPKPAKFPTWKCRVCGWENLAARPSCRNLKCHGRRDDPA